MFSMLETSEASPALRLYPTEGGLVILCMNLSFGQFLAFLVDENSLDTHDLNQVNRLWFISGFLHNEVEAQSQLEDID